MLTSFRRFRNSNNHVWISTLNITVQRSPLGKQCIFVASVADRTDGDLFTIMDENPKSTADQSAMEDGSQVVTCHSISEASFASKFWRAHTDKEWILKGEAGSGDNTADDKSEDDVSGVALKENIRLALPPSSNQNRGRRSKNQRIITHFHEDLKSDDLDGMVVRFEAKAEQSISLVLSPWPSTEPIPGNSAEQGDKEEASAPEIAASEAPSTTGKLYEIVLGANNNTSTTIRRFVSGNRNRNKGKNKNNEHSFVAIPSRVCRGFGSERDNTMTDESNEASTSAWTSYWVCLSNSRLFVGMGKVPGKECFGVLEKEEEQQQQQQESPKDQGKEDGATVDAPSTEGDQEKESNNESKVLPIRYVGIGNKAFQKKDSVVEVKNLVVTNVPPCLDGLLKNIPSLDDLPILCLAPVTSTSSSGMDIDEDAETLELKKYMEDYKAECLVRKKRAEKYGTDYKVQPMKDFLPWTMAKRLQGKHGNNNNVVGGAVTSGFVAGDIDFLDPKEISKREARLARFAASNDKNSNDETNSEVKNEASPLRDGLSIEQAWDKEGMLRPIRRDPPPYLWKESPANSDTLKITKAHDPFSMYDESTKAATWIADKLHISSIDWAAFKQIRNDDLIKHLEAYGPIKYIEWLGDVSCNVCFANKVSASRALVCLSNELPSPPPQAATEITEANAQNEESGVPGLPPTDSASVAPSTKIDLGCMTWRLGKRPIRKISNDRHGRKGTIARYLLRVATTEDVLIERPSSWPEPPGGFAPDRVLGPKSDFAGANNKKANPKNKAKKANPQQQQQQQQRNRRGSNSKRKRGRGENSGKGNNAKKNDKNERRNNNNKQNSNPVDLLNRGLSSSRGGFSVEEMEKERQAKKRQKTS